MIRNGYEMTTEFKKPPSLARRWKLLALGVRSSVGARGRGIWGRGSGRWRAAGIDVLKRQTSP